LGGPRQERVGIEADLLLQVVLRVELAPREDEQPEEALDDALAVDGRRPVDRLPPARGELLDLGVAAHVREIAPVELADERDIAARSPELPRVAAEVE